MPDLHLAIKRAERERLENTLLLHLRAQGLPQPVRELRFAAPRRWRFDFAWEERKIAAECEGGIYSGGRHTRGKGFEQDCSKYNEAAYRGWKVFRFTADMINSGEAIALLAAVLGELHGKV